MMKTIIHQFAAGLAALSLFIDAATFAAGIPEPGLVMYGAVRNTATGNARVTTGTLTWTITPASGSPGTIVTPLTDISGQYSYVLRVPFESLVGTATLSSNTLQLNSALTSYLRTNVMLNIHGSNYSVTIAAPATGYFTFNTADRGRLDEVDLTVNVPLLGGSTPRPSFASSPFIANGIFQLSVNGVPGQQYSLLVSSNLVTWSPLLVFTCTTVPTVVADPNGTNFPTRFYRIGQ